MTDPIRVVIADDHALVREGTSELLAKHPDIEVVAAAEDGISAVELINEFRPDVAQVDISMPGLTGIEVTRERPSRLCAGIRKGIPSTRHAPRRPSQLEPGNLDDSRRPLRLGPIAQDLTGHELFFWISDGNDFEVLA